MASERPEYNDKIIFHGAMAPPVYMGNATNPLIQFAVQNLDMLKVNVPRQSSREFFAFTLFRSSFFVLLIFFPPLKFLGNRQYGGCL